VVGVSFPGLISNSFIDRYLGRKLARVRAIIYGVGATGARAARQLISNPQCESLVLIDEDVATAEEAQKSLGEPARCETVDALRQETRVESFRRLCDDADVVVLTASPDHCELAEAALLCGTQVVSVSDDIETIRSLLQLDRIAKENDVALVVGAGFSPGISCLLACHAAKNLDVVDEIHVAKFGTGGPACARQHHKALRSESLDWRNQSWEKRAGGTGRELCWFPDPVGGLDCYVGALADSMLLLRAFPQLVRATSRVSATRRDQATKWLPMMRRPHPEGMIGAVRAEVRGWKSEVRNGIVLGMLDRPAVAAGVMASVMAELAVSRSLSRVGSGGVSELVVDTTPVLHRLAEKGVKAAVFEGRSGEELAV
jgi:hypothetical protein